MLNRENHSELFDRYLRKELTEAEKSEFDEFLLNDDAFNAAFTEYRTLVEGIRDYGRQALKAHLKAHTPKTPVRTFRIQRAAFAIAASLVLFLGIYAVIRYNTPETRQQEIATSTIIQKENAPLAEEQLAEPAKTPAEQHMAEADKPEDLSVPEALPPPVIEHDLAKEEEEKMPANVTTAGAGAEVIDDADGTYNILTDKKLRDTILFAFAADETKVKYKDLAKAETTSANKKILPSNNYGGYNNKADKEAVVDTVVKKKVKTLDAKGTQYIVEFWQSPINFKGYKMSGNTIQLFGINTPQLKLISYNGKTYLRNGNVFYQLLTCPDGCAYKAELDETILNVLMNE